MGGTTIVIGNAGAGKEEDEISGGRSH